MQTQLYRITKLKSDGSSKEIEDMIAKEVIFTLYLNQEKEQEFYCSPIDMKEMAVGYLYAEGKVSKQQDIIVAEYQPEGETPWIKLEIAREKLAEARGLQYVTGDRSQITPELCMQYEDMLLQYSEVFRMTGCIHAAALCREGQLCYGGEDISRFYAMYKAIGKALLSEKKLNEYLLCTTGRLPAPYMERVIRAGIPAVVSRSAPTDTAMKLANKYGVYVAGFAGRERINLYQPQLGACILAGGQGSRADGRDKGQLVLQDKTFLERLLMLTAEEEECIISYNRDMKNIKAVCEAYSQIRLKAGKAAVKIIPDRKEALDKGPMGGIYSVLCEAESAAVSFAPCDMPFYDKKAAGLLKSHFDNRQDAVVMKLHGRIQPLCAIYAKSCISAVKECMAEENYKLTHLLDKLRVVYLEAEEYGLPEEIFQNINTIEDYNRIQ